MHAVIVAQGEFRGNIVLQAAEISGCEYGWGSVISTSTAGFCRPDVIGSASGRETGLAPTPDPCRIAKNREETMRNPEVTLDFLDQFAHARNRHDTAAILAAMTSDCVLETSTGSTVSGTRYVGQAETRREFSTLSDSSPTPFGVNRDTSSLGTAG